PVTGRGRTLPSKPLKGPPDASASGLAGAPEPGQRSPRPGFPADATTRSPKHQPARSRAGLSASENQVRTASEATGQPKITGSFSRQEQVFELLEGRSRRSFMNATCPFPGTCQKSVVCGVFIELVDQGKRQTLSRVPTA